jgi:membrane-bound serine protease (ClpP class)
MYFANPPLSFFRRMESLTQCDLRLALSHSGLRRLFAGLIITIAFCGFANGALSGAPKEPKAPGDATAAANPEEPRRGPVYVIPLKEAVSDAQFFFLRRALKEADAGGAAAVVLELNTNGGSVSAMLDEVKALLQVRVPTIAWVNDKAYSAGALIALATRQIWMSPSATIGAAGVVTSNGEDLEATMRKKADSVIMANIRTACERNGHNPDVAEAFVITEKELKIGDEVIDSATQLLSLTAKEATKVYNGKPLLAAGVAGSLEELKRKAGLTGETRYLAPTGFESFAFLITSLAPLLLLGGIVGAYIELKAPGFGLPGIVSVICFILYFLGHSVAGLAGGEAFALFLIGALLIVAELTVLHGTLLPGVLGLLCVIGSVTWAMVDRWPGEAWLPTAEMLRAPLRNLLITGGLAAATIYALARTLPKTSFYGRLVMEATSGGVSSVNAIGAGHRTLSPGDLGVAATILRPTGKMERDGEMYDVTTDGLYLPAGTPLRVLEVTGFAVRVEAAESGAE